MVNPRFQRSVTQMGRKEFLQLLKLAQKTRPESARVSDAALISPKEWKKAEDLPFAVGDRVQVLSGKHRNKVGQIVAKYPFGNAFTVNGISESKMIHPIETKLQVGEEEYDPISDNPETFDYNNLRLVSTMRHESGEEQDVAIHSLSLGAEKYNPASNRHERVRYATHDPSVTVPWPLVRPQRVEEEKAALTTSPEVSDVRSHFVPSAVDSGIPLAAIPQVTNLNNRYKRGRYAKRITESDVAKYSAPEMPLNPRTRQLLEDIKNMPKPEPTPFTEDIREFIGAQIKQGLQERLQKEKEALKQYS